MTIESNYAIAIAKLSDWLINLALPSVFQPIRGKTKSNGNLCARFFPLLEQKLQVIARNSDWFIALFAPVVIGRSNYFGIGFSIVIGKPLYEASKTILSFSASLVAQIGVWTNCSKATEIELTSDTNSPVWSTKACERTTLIWSEHHKQAVGRWNDAFLGGGIPPKEHSQHFSCFIHSIIHCYTVGTPVLLQVKVREY